MVFHFSNHPGTPAIPEKDVTSFVFDTLNSDLDEANWGKRAIINGSTGKSLTYNQIYTQCTQLASGLQNRMMLQKGDVVLAVFDNQVNCSILFHATLMIGGVYSMAMPECTEQEIARRITLLQPKLVITTGQLLDKVQSSINLAGGVISKCPPRIYLSAPDRESSVPSILSLLTNQNYNRVKCAGSEDTDTTAVIGFTSGDSTGCPKAIEISHKALVSCAHLELSQFTQKERKSSQSTTAIIAMSMGNIYGLYTFAIKNLARGITSITSFLLPLECIFENVSKYQVTDIRLPPQYIELIRDNWKSVFSKYDISSVKRFSTSGSPLTVDLANFVKKDIGVRIHSFYGTSECLGIACLRAESSGETVGKPLFGIDIRIKNQNGKDLGVDETGELWIRSKAVMKSYYKDPKSTKEAFDKDGFFRIGDVGKVDSEGNIHLYGRIGDLIYHKDQIISPIGIEKLLNSHPGVKESCVIGAYDPKSKTELPYAYLVPSYTYAELPEEIPELLSWANNQILLDKMDCPLISGAIYVNKLSKNLMGGTLYMNMKQMYYRRSGVALPPSP